MAYEKEEAPERIVRYSCIGIYSSMLYSTAVFMNLSNISHVLICVKEQSHQWSQMCSVSKYAINRLGLVGGGPLMVRPGKGGLSVPALPFFFCILAAMGWAPLPPFNLLCQPVSALELVEHELKP